jgi:hypothetical protein
MQTFRPFGFDFVGNLSGSHGNELRTYAAANGANCPDLHKGAPVRLTAGVVTSITGTATGALLGVVNGVAYVDTLMGPRFANYLPADTSSAGFIDGDNRPQVYVVDNPFAVFAIQADASVSAGDVGLNFDVTTLGEDSVMGRSRYAVRAASRTTANTGSVKVVGLAKLPGNAWDNPFPVVEVKINQPILTTLSAAL